MLHRFQNMKMSAKVRKLALTLACAGLSLLAGLYPTLAPASLVGIAAAALATPRNYLPSLAIWVFVLIPIGYMDVSRAVGRYLTPAAIIVFVWQARIILAHPERLGRSTIASALSTLAITFALLSSAAGSYSIFTSVAWILTFFVCILMPLIGGAVSDDDVSTSLARTLATVGIFVGAVSALDFFFQMNPWSSLYKDQINLKTWSVFRTRSSLGHPLVAGVLGSACLATCIFARDSLPRWLMLSGATGSIIATLLTVSRTAVLAVIAGLAVGLVSQIMFGSNRARVRAIGGILISCILVGVLLFSPLLSERNNSSGGENSALYRVDGLHNAFQMFSERPILGFGPGTSADAYADLYSGLLESSALQLLVSLGMIGSALVFLGFFLLLMAGLRRGAIWEVSALTAVSVGISGFSAIDSNPGILVIFSALLYMLRRRIRRVSNSAH